MIYDIIWVSHVQRSLILSLCAYMLSCVWHFWDPIDCSPPGSSVHGIFQARILKWVAISYCRGSSQPRDQIQVSCVSCIAGESSLTLICKLWVTGSTSLLTTTNQRISSTKFNWRMLSQACQVKGRNAPSFGFLEWWIQRTSRLFKVFQFQLRPQMGRSGWKVFTHSRQKGSYTSRTGKEMVKDSLCRFHKRRLAIWWTLDEKAFKGKVQD